MNCQYHPLLEFFEYTDSIHAGHEVSASAYRCTWYYGRHSYVSGDANNPLATTLTKRTRHSGIPLAAQQPTHS